MRRSTRRNWFKLDGLIPWVLWASGLLILALMTSPDGRAASAANRLIREKSPYLLQHAHNPVDWYPWGREAFAKARQEEKPIFLSIGYSTCHWCHVMERESFENPEIAELLNRHFVSVKVDREEHPDVDHLYMNAVTAMTGHGGWPLTVFLTPEGKPFFGGTYFPPERRWNVSGMTELLPAVARAWQEKRSDVVASADQLTQTLQQQLAHTAPPAPVTLQWLHEAFQQAARTFDATDGGFGDAPKFPRAHELSFLLHYWARTHEAKALEMMTRTLDHMSRGGIHDHLGGGFYRYATDARWLVPHFEKMLYDQALLARAFLEAYRVTRRAEDAEMARGIFEYVLRDLTDPRGGFYAAEDADSEGEEGKFYVWTPEEIAAALGPDEEELFSRFYGVAPEGQVAAGGILHVERPLEAFAALHGLEASTLAQRLATSRATLLEARSRRVRPHRDDKILTSWNGLMIASLAYGAATLEEPRYLQAAQRAADMVLATLLHDGRLLRRYRDGEARYPGTLDDYAFFCEGLLELYDASLDPRWLAHAKALAAAMIERFWDPKDGGFFLRAADDEPLIVRAKEIYDGATPSGNSVAAMVLLRLGRLLADQSLEAFGRRTLETAAATVGRMPFGYPQMLMAADLALGPTQEVVIAGDPDDPQTRTMLRALRERFLPRAVVVLHPPRGPARHAIETLAPYVASSDPVDGLPTAYVCEDHVCSLPTTDVATMLRLLEQRRESREKGGG